ncbi:MAG: dephospho-CoA kinase [Thermoleophilia bacterium]
MRNSDKNQLSPVRVALTGGIGSGKSTALLMFAARGAAVLSSDRVVHELLEREDVHAKIAESLGIEPLLAGEEGRRQIAESVFAGELQLTRLEDILFPLVAGEVAAWQASAQAMSAPLTVVELPMLFEAGMESGFDRVVLVTAPAEIRRSRHEGRVGITDFEQRASRQLPESEKRARSDFVYDNTGSPEELDGFVAATVAAITGCEER